MRFLLPRSVLPAVLWLSLGGCTTPQSSAVRLTLVDDAGAVVYEAPTSYVVRKPESVIGLPGIGEIHVGVDGDPAQCRLVLSQQTVATALVILPHPRRADGGPCAQQGTARICFDDVRFSDGVRTFTARGCADENDLLYGYVHGEAPPTVGPKSYRTRCADIPSDDDKCPLTYLRLDDISVRTNDVPTDGFAFRYAGDTWQACFLERRAGPYRIAVFVEDSCGGESSALLEGDSATLDH